MLYIWKRLCIKLASFLEYIGPLGRLQLNLFVFASLEPIIYIMKSTKLTASNFITILLFFNFCYFIIVWEIVVVVDLFNLFFKYIIPIEGLQIEYLKHGGFREFEEIIEDWPDFAQTQGVQEKNQLEAYSLEKKIHDRIPDKNVMGSTILFGAVCVIILYIISNHN